MDLRELTPGDTFEDMPLVACPVCSKTAIHLGLCLDDDTMQQTFAHVVVVSPHTSEVLEACDWSPDRLV